MLNLLNLSSHLFVTLELNMTNEFSAIRKVHSIQSTFCHSEVMKIRLGTVFETELSQKICMFIDTFDKVIFLRGDQA